MGKSFLTNNSGYLLNISVSLSIIIYFLLKVKKRAIVRIIYPDNYLPLQISWTSTYYLDQFLYPEWI
jgi:hypothetical protein